MYSVYFGLEFGLDSCSCFCCLLLDRVLAFVPMVLLLSAQCCSMLPGKHKSHKHHENKNAKKMPNGHKSQAAKKAVSHILKRYAKTPKRISCFMQITSSNFTCSSTQYTAAELMVARRGSCETRLIWGHICLRQFQQFRPIPSNFTFRT